MLSISGQNLVGVSWITVSPTCSPYKLIVFAFPIVIFCYYSLAFLRQVNSGSTIIYSPLSLFTTFKVVSGRATLTKQQKKAGYIKSYNGPASTAFLGMLLFTAAELLLIFLFKQPVYYFRSF